MAPFHESHLEPRDLDPSGTFSITFGILALILIVVAILWGCVWPPIRVRYIDKYLPARTRFRDENHIPHPVKIRLWPKKESSVFPSHPALLRGAQSQRLMSRSPIYSSHILSSFDDQKTVEEDFDFSHARSRTKSFSNVNCMPARYASSTPSQHRLSTMVRWSVRKSATMPRTRMEYDRARSITSDHTYGDAKEYILAIPEPLVLRNKSPSSKHSASQLPAAEHQYSTEALRLQPPPRALLIQRETCLSPLRKQSVTSLGEKEICGASTTHSYVSEVSTFGEGEAGQEDEDTLFGTNSCSSGKAQSLADLSESGSEEDLKQEQASKSLAALNRLRTYRSLTGAKPIRPLTRAGTVTRPKTPVAEIRDLYDRAASSASIRSGTTSHLEKYLASQLATPDDIHQALTANQSSSNLTMSSSCLLPESLGTGSISPIEHQDKECTEFDAADSHHVNIRTASNGSRISSIYRVKENRKAYVGGHQPAKARSSIYGKKIGSYIPIAIQKSSVVRPVNNKKRVRTSPRKERKRGSSVYSRDTRGFSFARSSVWSRFDRTEDIASLPTESCDDFMTLPIHPSRIVPVNISEDPSAFSKDTAPKFSPRQPGMLALELNTSASPSRALQTNPSHLELQISSSNDTSNADDSDGSTISTELASVDAEAMCNSIPRLCIRESSNITLREIGKDRVEAVPSTQNFRSVITNSLSSSLADRDAPGGAQWL